MDFKLTDEQQAVADLAAQILGDASTHEALRAIERADGPRHDPALWSALAAAGLLGIALPEAHGGAGLGLVELGCLLTAAGKTAAAVPLLETLGFSASVIADLAPEALAGEWLPKVVAGEAVLTAAWHEELGDPSDPSTTAVGSGDDVRLTGTKVCVPAGLLADAAVVVAAGEGGPGLYLVETSAAGVTRTELDTTAKTPDALLELADAPARTIAVGADAVARALDLSVAAQCAFLLGTCEGALALTAQYTIDRKQFGQPIASFQAVGHRAADAYIDTEAIRLTTWQALWRLSAGMPASEEVAIAKFWASFGGQRVVHAGVHLHGGVGVDRDYPLHRFFVAAKQAELQLGGATPSLLRLGRLIAESA